MRDLGDGLLLRRGRADDAEALAELNASVLSDAGDEARAADVRNTIDREIGRFANDGGGLRVRRFPERLISGGSGCSSRG